MVGVFEKLRRHLPVAGVLIGGIVFLLIYGDKTLNPKFIEWLLFGDSAGHFLGWHFFRFEPWHFPLGAVMSYHYPHGSSLVYTDSIPLIAIPLKFFSCLLPPRFQYIGLWFLLCYMLQGLFGVLLLRRVTQNLYLTVVGLIFFLISPIMFSRTGGGYEALAAPWYQLCVQNRSGSGHAGLVAHWLILGALFLYFQEHTSKKGIVLWMLLLSSALVVYFYLFAMLFILWSAYLLKLLITKQRSAASIISLVAVSMVVSFLVMWVSGYFVIESSNAPAGGFGYFSMNISAPFNPAPYNSFFLKAKPLGDIGQFEGFNYLGVGMLFLFFIGCCCFIANRPPIGKKNLPLLITALILSLWALSNRISVYDVSLVEFRLPLIIDGVLNITRSSGRMFWPVYYLIVFFSITAVVKFFSPSKSALLLSLCLIIQCLDLLPLFSNANLGNRVWESPLQSVQWEHIVEKKKHVALVPAINDGDAYIPFALLAADHQATINSGRLARWDYKKRMDYIDRAFNNFKSGRLDGDTLYILRNDVPCELPFPEKFLCDELDGVRIVYKSK